MNETMSLLMATTILALGGLGLYMYKSGDSVDSGEDNKNNEETRDDKKEEGYNEDSIFSSNFWGFTKSDDDDDEDDRDTRENDKEYKADDNQDADDNEEKTIKRKTKGAAKTKRNKRGSGTKRRYY